MIHNILPMIGIYLDDQEQEITSVLPQYAQICDQVVIYTRGYLVRDGLYERISNFVTKNCSSINPNFKIIGGFLIDKVIPSDGNRVTWENLYKENRWIEIANLCKTVMLHTHRRDVYLVHEPATNPYYDILAQPNWSELENALQIVKKAGVRCWFDIPRLHKMANGDIIGHDYIKAYMDANKKPLLVNNKRIKTQRYEWTPAYFGTFEPVPGDWRYEVYQDHKQLSGSLNVRHRLFVTESGVWTFNDPNKIDFDCWTIDAALEFSQEQSSAPLWYIKQSDWNGLPQSVINT